jgi:NTP pyrophosphatase (non-canonical NTP hydrolase)
MTQTFAELRALALKNRDEYSEIERAVGGKQWDVLNRATGFAGDVGELLQLVMAKQGLRRSPKATDDALAHELSDCLWSIMVIADELGIDLEQAFVKKMEELRVRIEQEKQEVQAL